MTTETKKGDEGTGNYKKRTALETEETARNVFPNEQSLVLTHQAMGGKTVGKKEAGDKIKGGGGS